MLTCLDAKAESPLHKVMCDYLELDFTNPATLDMRKIFIFPNSYDRIRDGFRLPSNKLLPLAQYNRIHLLHRYAEHLCQELGNVPDAFEWLSVSRQSFLNWIACPPPDRNDTAVNPATRSTTEHESLSSWHKGVPHDPHSFSYPQG